MKSTCVVFLFLFVSGYLHSQTKNFIDQPYLETSATVDTSVIPDMIYMSIILDEKDKRNKKSLEELETDMIAQLKLIEIDVEEQLSVMDMGSNFKKYFLRGKDIIKKKKYSLLVYDALTAGKVAQNLESIGISNVTLDRFEISNIDELTVKLKSKAIMKAKLQAEHLVEPLDQSIGRAIHISDIIYNNRLFFDPDTYEESVIIGYSHDAKSFSPADLNFEKIVVSSEVRVNFRIE